MQVAQPVAVATSAHDSDCYFCKAPEKPTDETNDLVDEPDEDAAEMENSLGEYKFKNDAGKLGTALGGKPDAITVSAGKKRYDAAVAAHHLIPGNASLANSDLMEQLWTDKSAVGNIGYNVNASPNGVWLPGNYAVRPWGTDAAAFEASSGGVTAQDFANRAMYAWKAQFHDAHEKYSNFVITVLNEINDKLEANETLWCPKQKKKDKSEHSQLFPLVGRLNTVSARMKRMLIFPASKWKSNVYTSRFVAKYRNPK